MVLSKRDVLDFLIGKWSFHWNKFELGVLVAKSKTASTTNTANVEI